MKKNLFAVFLAITMIFFISACQNSQEKKEINKNEDTNQMQTNKQEESDDGIKIKKIEVGDEIFLSEGKFVAVVKEVRQLKDINKNPAITIVYSFENKSEEPASPIMNCTFLPKQDGKELDLAILDYEDELPDSVDILEDVQPKVKVEPCQSSYNLNSQSDVEIQVVNFDDIEKRIIHKLTVPISK